MLTQSCLGPEIIPGDQYRQSPNGKILAGIINRHALCVVKGMFDKKKEWSQDKGTQRQEMKKCDWFSYCEQWSYGIYWWNTRRWWKDSCTH